VLNYAIKLEDYDEDVYEYIDEGIIDVSREKVNRAEPVWFQVVARDDDGKILGGAVGKFNYDVVLLDTIWVDEKMRGTGIGRQLIDGFEAHSRKLGAVLAWLETRSWQARPFYEKCGYRVFGELPYLGGRHAQYFMRKDL
jgi:GNAT superfamily N-acetyltransferase